jgi:hypothetical protein
LEYTFLLGLAKTPWRTMLNCRPPVPFSFCTFLALFYVFREEKLRRKNENTENLSNSGYSITF